MITVPRLLKDIHTAILLIWLNHIYTFVTTQESWMVVIIKLKISQNPTEKIMLDDDTGLRDTLQLT